MAEVSGKDCTLKISGTAVAEVGMTAPVLTANTVYQVVDVTKRVLDRTATIYVHVATDAPTAEAGTNTTTVKITGHGLITNDMIENTTRSFARRLITYVDANTFTVTAIAGQTSGDNLAMYTTNTAATVNRLNGKVTFPTSEVRGVAISTSYLPMTTVGYANAASKSMMCDMLDDTVFGDSYKSRTVGLKSASGTLTQLDVTDTTYSDALTAGNPIVIEYLTSSTAEPTRFWAILDSDEVTAAVDGLQNEIVSWTSTDAWMKLGI